VGHAQLTIITDRVKTVSLIRGDSFQF
jgi:hypothetical protein